MGGIFKKPDTPKVQRMPVPEDTDAEEARADILRQRNRLVGRRETILSQSGNNAASQAYSRSLLGMT